MRPVRAVLDTNILVAAALLPAEVPRHCLAIRRTVDFMLAEGTLLATAATLAELDEVLRRPEFDRYRRLDDRLRALDRVLAAVVRVEPASVGRLCRDPDDDMFLAAALGGDADWLVTADKALLAVRRVGRTPIVRPGRFVREVREGRSEPRRESGQNGVLC